eukprot:584151-Pyramimonas_sp.AAC.1
MRQRALPEAVQASYGALQAKACHHKEQLAAVVERGMGKRKAPAAPPPAGGATGPGGGAPAEEGAQIP